jgi:hypothetical protein
MDAVRLLSQHAQILFLKVCVCLTNPSTFNTSLGLINYLADVAELV